MKTAVILHGMPSPESYKNPNRDSQSNSHWLPWLQQQLLLHDILAQTPELPEPSSPDYNKWLSVFSKFDADNQTILVGHSCGGGFLLRWLSENRASVKQLVLVAPWLDPRRILDSKMMDFDLDAGIIDRVGKIDLFYSDNDGDDINDSVALIKSKLPKINMHLLRGLGHFTKNDMGRTDFPELFNQIVL